MRPEITIRPFRLADMERILQIELAAFGDDAYDRKLFAELFHKSGGMFLVAVRGRRICGYMVTCMHGGAEDRRAELVSVAVDPPARGKGAASRLMKSTLRRLRVRKANRFTLVVRVTNHPALALYEQYGFERVRKVPGYYGDGEDGVLMRKMLTTRRARGVPDAR